MSNTILNRYWLALILLAGLAGCSDGNDSDPESQNVGFEIIEIQSPGSLRAWISPDITREEFDAVRAMAQKAREENEALKARLEALEAKG